MTTAQEAAAKLGTARELADLLGVGRGTFYRWWRKYADFPEPVRRTPTMWDVAEVRAWHEANAEARNLGPQPRR